MTAVRAAFDGTVAGLQREICCHTFRATGITSFLLNGGLAEAQRIANHESPRTTVIYNRSCRPAAKSRTSARTPPFWHPKRGLRHPSCTFFADSARAATARGSRARSAQRFVAGHL